MGFTEDDKLEPGGEESFTVAADDAAALKKSKLALDAPNEWPGPATIEYADLGDDFKYKGDE